MPRTPTSPVQTRKRAQSVARKLQAAMPEAKVELSHRSPFELLVATILSAQCTDQRVNQVTPVLFRRYKTPSELSKARLPELEEIIRSTGFFKSKAKNLVACAAAITAQFDGRVPTILPKSSKTSSNYCFLRNGPLCQNVCCCTADMYASRASPCARAARF